MWGGHQSWGRPWHSRPWSPERGALPTQGPRQPPALLLLLLPPHRPAWTCRQPWDASTEGHTLITGRVTEKVRVSASLHSRASGFVHETRTDHRVET